MYFTATRNKSPDNGSGSTEEVKSFTWIDTYNLNCQPLGVQSQTSIPLHTVAMSTDVSPRKRGLVVAMVELGMSYTVGDAKGRIKTLPCSLSAHARPGSGRPPALNHRTRR